MVHRVGEMLRFQAEAGVLRINLAVGSRELPIQKVASIKLHSWLRGQHFHDSASLWFINASGQSQSFAAAV